jgi:RNA polymerase sigma-70 factor, ECF subfamily
VATEPTSSPEPDDSDVDAPPSNQGAGDDPASDAAPESGVPGTEPTRGGPARVNRALEHPSNLAERRREAEEDRALVERAQAGDKTAFRQLVERHQRRAFAIAVGLVRDENDAREIVQEAFLRVYRSLDKFQGGSSFFTWLYRIVANLAIDHLRKPSRREQETLDASNDDDPPMQLAAPDDADPGELIRRREIGERLQKALDALPAYHRGVILMREVEGMSYQEMAEAMNVSKGTIMSRLFHARQKLQRALAECYREQIGAQPKPAEEDDAGDAAHDDQTREP